MSTIDETVSFSLEVNIEEAYTQLRKYETLLHRTLGLINRMGLPEDLKDTIALIQRTIAMINKLRLTLIALQTATGPLGIALGVFGGLSLMMDYADFSTELKSR